MAINDLRKLVRAYSLLAASCDNQRAIVGPVSPSWIASEVERNLPLADIPPATFATVRGADILTETFGDELGADTIDPTRMVWENIDRSHVINSNRLPKLEPTINAAVLVGNLLLGVHYYGNRGKGYAPVDHDLIVAGIVHEAHGLKHYHSQLLPRDCATIDDALIVDQLGADILSQLKSVTSGWQQFLAARNAGTPPEPVPAPLANVIAAIAVGRLRLSARAAGDQIFSTLDEQKCAELRRRQIEPHGEFAERPYLENDFQIARAALALPGVDYHALREPIENTLMMAVDDALADSDKVRRLVGRRGKAIHDVHNNMPMMEYYDAAEHPDDLATVHVAALDLMRHLDKCRRKGYNTMLAHAFHIAGTIESAFGDALGPRLASMALLHDIVEDGSVDVAGYDQSLHKLKLRFGGPLAAMVAELTDSHSRLDGAKKAQTTLHSETLMQPEQQYNVDRFSRMPLRATDSETPYTLDGIIVKLADTAVTFEEGVRNPELMSGWWRHSGIRIYWAQNTRGSIVHPLIERLLNEIVDSENDPGYAKRTAALDKKMLDGLRQLLLHLIEWSDRYAVVNLAMLAKEYQLANDQHMKLQTAFFDTSVDVREFETQFIDTLLDDKKLEDNITAGNVAQKSCVTLYRYCENGNPEKDCTTFLRYRESALWRAQISRQLGADGNDETKQKDRNTVLRLFQQCTRLS